MYTAFKNYTIWEKKKKTLTNDLLHKKRLCDWFAMIYNGGAIRRFEQTSDIHGFQETRAIFHSRDLFRNSLTGTTVILLIPNLFPWKQLIVSEWVLSVLFFQRQLPSYTHKYTCLSSRIYWGGHNRKQRAEFNKWEFLLSTYLFFLPSLLILIRDNDHMSKKK